MSFTGKEINNLGAQAFQSNGLKTVNREDLRGKWSVFLFYPAGFAFVCPAELEDLENNYAVFQKVGCEIYSVSCDTHLVHKAWHDHSERTSKITYPVLTDPTQALVRDFEVLIPEAGLAGRGAFIVDPDLKIIAYEVNAGNAGHNAEELLRKVQACWFAREHGDKACLTKQIPGAEALRPSLGLVSAL